MNHPIITAATQPAPPVRLARRQFLLLGSGLAGAWLTGLPSGRATVQAASGPMGDADPRTEAAINAGYEPPRA